MTYRCLLCGRDKFIKPRQAHKCVGGYRRNFRKAERMSGKACFEAVATALPCFIRLLIQVEASQANAIVVNKIADFAETQMPLVVGFKLIKATQETVHSIETYGSPIPPTPKANRKP